MKVFRLLALLVCASSLGCYHITYRTHAPSLGAPSSEEWHHNFLSGLVEGSDPVNVTDICAGDFAQVDRQVTVVNWLADALLEAAASGSIFYATSHGGRVVGGTLPVSLWSPKTVSVTCAAKPATATAVSAK